MENGDYGTTTYPIDNSREAESIFFLSERPRRLARGRPYFNTGGRRPAGVRHIGEKAHLTVSNK